MKFINDEAKAGWELTVTNNQDPYGTAGVGFARAWADEMEKRMEAGQTLAECAKSASHDVDKDFGITGFMYGCAVSILSQCWLHGEELRKWHNKDLAPKQADAANDKPGAVLNPALVTLTLKD
jgi:hypothetical protein